MLNTMCDLVSRFEQQDKLKEIAGEKLYWQHIVVKELRPTYTEQKSLKIAARWIRMKENRKIRPEWCETAGGDTLPVTITVQW